MTLIQKIINSLRNKLINADTAFHGKFVCEHVRDGAVIDRWDVSNVVTVEGRRQLLESALANGTQIATWYIGIYSGAVSPLESWVSAQLSGSNNPTEVSAEYDEATRELWIQGLHATGASISNAVANGGTVATFTFNAPETIRGAMLLSAAAKDGSGDAVGTLMAIANFAPRTVGDTDLLNITYELTTTSTP